MRFLASIAWLFFSLSSVFSHAESADQGWHVTVPAKGGLTFDMKVNGHGPYGTVFDTGAVNLMSASFAQQLGLPIDEKTSDLGAIGGRVQARTVHVDRLTVGELNIDNQTFYVLDMPSEAGTPQMLVGWEFMQLFAVKMDAQRNEITFYEGAHFRYDGSGQAVPIYLHSNGNGIDADAKIGDISGRFLIDSGNQIGTFLNAAFVKRNDLVRKLGARYRGYNGRGFGGDSPVAWYVRVPNFQIGHLAIRGAIVRLQTMDESYNGKLAGNIGQDILERFVVTIDCKRSIMYLQKTPGWNKPAPFNRLGVLVDFNHGSDEIKTVFPKSPAEIAGLLPGDRILSINGAKPSDDPNEPLFRQPAGTTLHLQVQRGASTRDYEIRLRKLL